MDYSAILIPVITLVTVQAIIMDLGQFRFDSKKLFIILLIELVLQVIVSGSMLIFGGLGHYAKWYVLTMDIPAILTFLYISKRHILQDLFTVIVTLFISFTVTLPSIWIAYHFDGSYIVYNFTRVLIFAVLFFLLHKYIRKPYQQLQDEIERGWEIFCILPMIGVAINYLEYIRYSKTHNFRETLFVSSLVVIFMINVLAVFYYVFIQLHDKYVVQEQQRILFMQIKAQRDQFIQQKEAAEKTNRRWHDLRHNTEELIGLLEAGDTETAIDYLKEQRGMTEIPKEEYCLHPSVNSILCFWAARARKAGISMEIKTDVPDKLEIEPMELSALFANAFENAYNACISLPENEKRFIKVEARYNGKRLAIGFMNNCKDDVQFEGNMPISSKEGGGIGTQSMAYTVSRFHGTAFFEAKDGEFSARFVLNV